MKEPANRQIVAWFDHLGFPMVVYARDDQSAGEAGEQVGRRWFPAGLADDAGALSWDELTAKGTVWKGPIRLHRADQRQNEPGS